MPTTVRELLKRLRTDGWAVVRQKGSHRPLQHPTKSNTITLAGAPHKPVPTASEYLVLFEQGPGSWGASVPDLPGVYAIGDTRGEVEGLIQEAVEVHVGLLRVQGELIPTPHIAMAWFGSPPERWRPQSKPTNHSSSVELKSGASRQGLPCERLATSARGRHVGRLMQGKPCRYKGVRRSRKACPAATRGRPPAPRGGGVATRRGRRDRARPSCPAPGRGSTG